MTCSTCTQSMTLGALPVVRSGALDLNGLGRGYIRRPLGAVDPALSAAWTVASIAGGALGAYHGYKRNRGSIGWAIGWALLGSIFPVITLPVSLAQGFGKPAGR